MNLTIEISLLNNMFYYQVNVLGSYVYFQWNVKLRCREKLKVSLLNRCEVYVSVLRPKGHTLLQQLAIIFPIQIDTPLGMKKKNPIDTYEKC